MSNRPANIELATRCADAILARLPGILAYDALGYEERKALEDEVKTEFGLNHNVKEGLVPEWYETQGKVGNILWDRVRRAKLEAKRGELPAAVYAYAIATFDERGRRIPEPRDLTHIAKAATTNNGYRSKYHPVYVAEAGCSLRLKLKEAWSIGYCQEAWADHSQYVVPVEGKASGAELEVCKRNLSRFFEAARSTNGLAGYGSSYSHELIETEHGFLVIIDQRSSIPD